jgi:hypothetical protein
MVGAAVVALSCAYVARWDIAAIALLVGIVAGFLFKQSFRPFIEGLESASLAGRRDS